MSSSGKKMQDELGDLPSEVDHPIKINQASSQKTKMDVEQFQAAQDISNPVLVSIETVKERSMLIQSAETAQLVDHLSDYIRQGGNLQPFDMELKIANVEEGLIRVTDDRKYYFESENILSKLETYYHTSTLIGQKLTVSQATFTGLESEGNALDVLFDSLTLLETQTEYLFDPLSNLLSHPRIMNAYQFYYQHFAPPDIMGEEDSGDESQTSKSQLSKSKLSQQVICEGGSLGKRVPIELTEQPQKEVSVSKNIEKLECGNIKIQSTKKDKEPLNSPQKRKNDEQIYKGRKDEDAQNQPFLVQENTHSVHSMKFPHTDIYQESQASQNQTTKSVNATSFKYPTDDFLSVINQLENNQQQKKLETIIVPGGPSTSIADQVDNSKLHSQCLQISIKPSSICQYTQPLSSLSRLGCNMMKKSKAKPKTSQSEHTANITLPSQSKPTCPVMPEEMAAVTDCAASMKIPSNFSFGRNILLPFSENSNTVHSNARISESCPKNTPFAPSIADHISLDKNDPNLASGSVTKTKSLQKMAIPPGNDVFEIFDEPEKSHTQMSPINLSDFQKIGSPQFKKNSYEKRASPVIIDSPDSKNRDTVSIEDELKPDRIISDSSSQNSKPVNLGNIIFLEDDEPIQVQKIPTSERESVINLTTVEPQISQEKAKSARSEEKRPEIGSQSMTLLQDRLDLDNANRKHTEFKQSKDPQPQGNNKRKPERPMSSIEYLQARESEQQMLADIAMNQQTEISRSPTIHTEPEYISDSATPSQANNEPASQKSIADISQKTLDIITRSVIAKLSEEARKLQRELDVKSSSYRSLDTMRKDKPVSSGQKRGLDLDEEKINRAAVENSIDFIEPIEIEDLEKAIHPKQLIGEKVKFVRSLFSKPSSQRQFSDPRDLLTAILKTKSLEGEEYQVENSRSKTIIIDETMEIPKSPQPESHNFECISSIHEPKTPEKTSMPTMILPSSWQKANKITSDMILSVYEAPKMPARVDAVSHATDIAAVNSTTLRKLTQDSWSPKKVANSNIQQPRVMRVKEFIDIEIDGNYAHDSIHKAIADNSQKDRYTWQRQISEMKDNGRVYPKPVQGHSPNLSYYGQQMSQSPKTDRSKKNQRFGSNLKNTNANDSISKIIQNIIDFPDFKIVNCPSLALNGPSNITSPRTEVSLLPTPNDFSYQKENQGPKRSQPEKSMVENKSTGKSSASRESSKSVSNPAIIRDELVKSNSPSLQIEMPVSLQINRTLGFKKLTSTCEVQTSPAQSLPESKSKPQAIDIVNEIPTTAMPIDQSHIDQHNDGMQNRKLQADVGVSFVDKSTSTCDHLIIDRVNDMLIMTMAVAGFKVQFDCKCVNNRDKFKVSVNDDQLDRCVTQGKDIRISGKLVF